MNRCRTVVYLVIFLTLLITNTAIASEQEPEPTSLDNKVDLLHSCGKTRPKFSWLTTKVSAEDVTQHQKVQQSRVKQKNINDLTQASFWWAAEQFDPFDGQLVQNWLAQPQKQQINLVVNWQLWTLLDYLGRYRFVNQFGSVARKYGYGLNIFNQKQQCLAVYKYNSLSNPPKWELYLENLGQDSLQVKPGENPQSVTEDSI